MLCSLESESRFPLNFVTSGCLLILGLVEVLEIYSVPESLTAYLPLRLFFISCLQDCALIKDLAVDFGELTKAAQTFPRPRCPPPFFPPLEFL